MNNNGKQSNARVELVMSNFRDPVCIEGVGRVKAKRVKGHTVVLEVDPPEAAGKITKWLARRDPFHPTDVGLASVSGHRKKTVVIPANYSVVVKP